MANEKWMLKNKKADFSAICKEFGVTEVISRLLVNRGKENLCDIRKYLHSDLKDLYPPEEMKDMEKVCTILKQKISDKKLIRIIGDYDVDGVVSTYILLTVLTECNAEVDYKIPHRQREGYGINMQMISQAHEDGIDTILTCDNGISAQEQTAYAREWGMTVLITDHHDIPDMLPPADAIVNPKQADCYYPFPELCGAGVAYKLAQALYESCGKAGEEKKFLQYAAIATVCDVMELTDENRILVKYGLKQLRQTNNIGLRALMEVIGIEEKKISTYHLGYILGPCLNATGRLESAVRGVELLAAETEDAAGRLAKELHELNEVRKAMTSKELNKAKEMVESTPLLKDRVLVLYLPECHESLAGIIAGRLRECYYRPAIVLTRGEECVKGSGRSIKQYHLYEELKKCGEYLLKFGGHPLAAGLSLNEEQIDGFRTAINAGCTLSEEDLIPKISIDAALALSGLSEELVQELEILEPFGKGNEKPVFAEKDLIVNRALLLGKNTKVLKFSVTDRFGRSMDAIYFGDTERFIEDLIDHYGEEEVRRLYQGRAEKVRLSVTYYPSINEYNGNRSLQIVISDYQFGQA